METIIKVENLVHRIGRRKTVIQDLSLEVYSGERLGLFGTRGAGKTSLLHILAGVEHFSSGRVEVLGSNVRTSDAFRHGIGLVTQQKSLFQDMTVAENLDFIAALKNVPRSQLGEIIERYELGAFLKDRVSALEIGPYQRLSLACAMLNRPRILFADELIKDIDLYSLGLITRELEDFQAQGGTCVCAFSNMAYCGKMSRVVWLEGGNGKLYEPQAAAAEWNRLLTLYTIPGERHDV